MAITIDTKISESATTSVYRAFDDTLSRDVLLKVLHRHLAHDEHLRERFIREARACASLRSDNIVQVYDLREHEGSPAIIAEFVEGRSLKDVIAEGRQRTFTFAEKVAVHVLRGLAAAHARGITHRDIKPGNILVSKSGTIKITDFGLAQLSVAPTLTSEGTIVGTPAYLAPEVLRGEAADARTDLFSLGATVVETLTGRQLFEGSTYSECLNRISQFKLEMLDPLAAQSSREFVAFLKKLMHPDRAQRYASPGEALEALGRAGSSEYVLPEALQYGTSVRTFWSWGAAVLVVLVLLGLYYVVRDPADTPAGEPVSSTTLQRPSILQSASPADTLESKIDSSLVRVEGRPAVRQQPSARRTESAVPGPDSGSIVLLSTPGAKVHIDSVYAGEFPLPYPLRVSAGAHTLIFTHPLFAPVVRQVRVEPGKELTVESDFLERAAYLRCSSVPWAEVSIDGQYRETTPIDRPIVVAAGTHRVRFYHPAFGDSVWDVTLAPRETVRVSVTFKP